MIAKLYQLYIAYQYSIIRILVKDPEYSACNDGSNLDVSIISVSVSTRSE